MAGPPKDGEKKIKQNLTINDENMASGHMTNINEHNETEIDRLRRQLSSMEKELRYLHECRFRLDKALQQNEKMESTVRDIREKMEVLKKEIEKLTAPPASIGTFYSSNKDGTADIMLGGRKMKVNVKPDIPLESLRVGQELVLNEALNVIEAREYIKDGEVGQLVDTLDDKRVIISLHSDEEKVAILSDNIKSCKLSVGDNLLYEAKSGLIIEKLPKADVQELILEEVPDVRYEDIGGLSKQIESIRDAVELPSLYPELYDNFKLRPPKGILLYGPPGCGKTLIAKAVARSIAERLSDKRGEKATSYFLHIKGPELLNKYVGESERKIREVFQKAREKASSSTPVIVFFDEMDALFRTRGSGISSDTESTIVPQFLSEIDGVETLSNVIVIGASNRQDLIDPAILRSGRLDIRIKIDRPNKDGARDIFSKYFKTGLPLDSEEVAQDNNDSVQYVERIINKIVDFMYEPTEDNKFLEVTYASGEKEVLYFKDFISGAMIEGIVNRAKTRALKRSINTNKRGMKEDDFFEAIAEEYRENEDLPNTTNPDDWAKISGRKGEKIIHVRTIGKDMSGARNIETISTGHYL